MFIILVRQGKVAAVLNKEFIQLYPSTSASNAAGNCSQIGVRGVQPIQRATVHVSSALHHTYQKCIMNFQGHR